MHPKGFTLVELLIVVALLGIISAIVLPQIGSQRPEAVRSALQSNVTQVGMVLEYRKSKSPDGSYPTTFEPEWFVGGALPHHPDQMAGMPAVEIVSTKGLLHPRAKALNAASAGAYWYNSVEGVFRARVKSQGSAAATQAYYDAVNGTSGASGAAAAGVAGASAHAVGS